MGRIKSTMVKKAARQLLESEDVFTTNFEHNKKMLDSLMPSKPVRNKIAGYISRLKTAEKAPKRVKKAPVPKLTEHPRRQY